MGWIGWSIHHSALTLHEYLSHIDTMLKRIIPASPYSGVVLYEFWGVVRVHCFRGITHSMLLLADFSIRAYNILFLVVFPMHRIHMQILEHAWEMENSQVDTFRFFTPIFLVVSIFRNMIFLNSRVTFLETRY